jgi:hypothetical protein
MGHVTDVYTALACEPEGMSPHVRPGSKYESSIEVHFNEEGVPV